MRVMILTRMVGTIWQIGVLTQETVHFFGAKWVISSGVLVLQKERVSRGLDIKWYWGLSGSGGPIGVFENI